MTHVQPRVLDMSQIAALASRVEAWAAKVQEAVTHMENHSPELFVQ